MDFDYKHLEDIGKDTGCIKPCKYKKYRLDWDREPMPVSLKATDGFGLLATSNYTMVGIIITTAEWCSQKRCLQRFPSHPSTYSFSAFKHVYAEAFKPVSGSMWKSVVR